MGKEHQGARPICCFHNKFTGVPSCTHQYLLHVIKQWNVLELLAREIPWRAASFVHAHAALHSRLLRKDFVGIKRAIELIEVSFLLVRDIQLAWYRTRVRKQCPRSKNVSKIPRISLSGLSGH